MLVTSEETVNRNMRRKLTRTSEMSKGHCEEGAVNVITLIPYFTSKLLAKGSDDRLIARG
jgi:hypothetical protein